MQAAYNLSIQNRLPRSTKAARRDKAKRKKLEALTTVSPSAEHLLCKSFFLDGRPIFFSGTPVTNTTILPHQFRNGHTLCATQHLKVVDTTVGARLKLDNGDTVFTLIPRLKAIQNLKQPSLTVQALYALENAQTKAEIRGKTRITVPEDDGKYTTVGLKPNRGGPGISESWPKRLSADDRKAIMKLMTLCEDAAKAYLPSDEMRGLGVAQQLLGQWCQMEGRGDAEERWWGSLACGKNYYLNVHVDNDFFYSLTTIASDCRLQEHSTDAYNMQTEISNYFAFPEQGVAVALRPGDMLIFNPKYQHCLSSRTSFYQQKDVFCLSLYLKTAVVGGNDNSVPIP